MYRCKYAMIASGYTCCWSAWSSQWVWRQWCYVQYLWCNAYQLQCVRSKLSLTNSLNT